MRVLVINSGSSSIKYVLFNMSDERSLEKGEIEHLTPGEAGSSLVGYQKALQQILSTVRTHGIDAVGHRVVHGGATFSLSTLIDDEVCTAIDRLSVLAPLHNPPNLAGIHATRRLLPGVPEVAVFDTAFHRDIPDVAATYPLPAAVAEAQAIRRYGFHGTNCAWCLTAVAAHYRRPPSELNLIVAHLGAGASVTAIRNGRSADTSMGMTPLEGLMMQTRSGDIDPAIVLLLARSGMSLDDVDKLLNRESGALAIAGEADMRTLADRSRTGDVLATLARAMYAYRVQKYISAYASVVWPIDALIFTGGIGENDTALRKMICAPLGFLGIELDEGLNQTALDEPLRRINRSGSTIAVVAVKADEERQIARETVSVVTAGRG